MLVHQVKWIPAEKDRFIECLCLSVGSECFIHEVAHIEFNSWSEPLLLHPRPAISCESQVFAADCFEFVHNFGSSEVGLPAVRQNAHRARVSAK